jgi:hypothetical protein
MLTNNKYNTRSYAYCFEQVNKGFEQVDKGIFINKHLVSPSSFVVVHLLNRCHLLSTLPSSNRVYTVFMYILHDPLAIFEQQH